MLVKIGKLVIDHATYMALLIAPNYKGDSGVFVFIKTDCTDNNKGLIIRLFFLNIIYLCVGSNVKQLTTLWKIRSDLNLVLIIKY